MNLPLEIYPNASESTNDHIAAHSGLDWNIAARILQRNVAGIVSGGNTNLASGRTKNPCADTGLSLLASNTRRCNTK
jgi:uncharacterized protein (DUF2345 family)